MSTDPLAWPGDSPGLDGPARPVDFCGQSGSPVAGPPSFDTDPDGVDAGLGGFDPVAKIGDIAASAGIRRVEMVAWRDLDHPEAGGSEVHAASIAERWAAAGVELTVVASRPEGVELPGGRDGYRVVRPAGRYGIFPAVAAPRLAARAAGRLHPTRVAPRLAARAAGRLDPSWVAPRPAATVEPAPGRWRSGPGGPDATVEFWNGMPFFSPLWADRPRLVFLHHVHDRMWDLVLPCRLAALGRFIEGRLAPPVYRHTTVVTLSESSRDGIIDTLRLDPARVHVVAPGVDDAFGPGSAKSARPLVVAVGRLVRYKRFDLLVDALAGLKDRHPGLEAVIAGEGAERPALQARIDGHGAAGWIHLPGYVGSDQLVELYQRAWVLASPSAFEGWGLTISEAGACATPAVASPITGHVDAIADGITGFLAEPGPAMTARLDELLSDALLRRRMSRAALHRSRQLTWDRTALQAMRLLADQSPRR